MTLALIGALMTVASPAWAGELHIAAGAVDCDETGKLKLALTPSRVTFAPVWASAPINKPGKPGALGAGTLTFKVNGKTYKADFNATMTAYEVADAINRMGAPVRAAVVNNGLHHRLVASAQSDSNPYAFEETVSVGTETGLDAFEETVSVGTETGLDAFEETVSVGTETGLDAFEETVSVGTETGLDAFEETVSVGTETGFDAFEETVSVGAEAPVALFAPAGFDAFEETVSVGIPIQPAVATFGQIFSSVPFEDPKAPGHAGAGTLWLTLGDMTLAVDVTHKMSLYDIAAAVNDEDPSFAASVRKTALGHVLEVHAVSHEVASLLGVDAASSRSIAGATLAFSDTGVMTAAVGHISPTGSDIKAGASVAFEETVSVGMTQPFSFEETVSVGSESGHDAFEETVSVGVEGPLNLRADDISFSLQNGALKLTVTQPRNNAGI